MEGFQTWSPEEVSDWMVEKGLPEDVAKLFEGTKFRHFLQRLIFYQCQYHVSRIRSYRVTP